MSSAKLDSTSMHIGGSEVKVYGVAEDHIFRAIERTGAPYERDLLDFTATLLPQGRPGLVLDVGANLGNHSIYFAIGAKRRVVAFEPVPRNIEILRKNINANGLTDVVEVVEAAAMSQPGGVRIQQRIDGNLGSFAVHKTGGVSAIATTVDREYSRRGRPDVALMKIDVEGAELEVLRGADTVLSEQRPVVVAEVHDPESTAEIGWLLKKYGYAYVTTLGVVGQDVVVTERGSRNGPLGCAMGGV